MAYRYNHMGPSWTILDSYDETHRMLIEDTKRLTDLSGSSWLAAYAIGRGWATLVLPARQTSSSPPQQFGNMSKSGWRVAICPTWTHRFVPSPTPLLGKLITTDAPIKKRSDQSYNTWLETTFKKISDCNSEENQVPSEKRTGADLYKICDDANSSQPSKQIMPKNKLENVKMDMILTSINYMGDSVQKTNWK